MIALTTMDLTKLFTCVCIFLPILIYISSQNFFNCPFVENNFDSVLGAYQKINMNMKRKIAPAVIPTVPSEEKV